MDLIADLAERYAHDEIRVTHSQNLVLAHVRKRDLHAVWPALAAAGLATPNLDLVTDIIACPGLDYCALANARSIPVAQKIAQRFADLDRQHDIGEIKIKISGCINACGHHHAGHIGILGVDRKGEEAYQLCLGGSGAEDASLAKILGPGFSESRRRRCGREGDRGVSHHPQRPAERFLDTYRRSATPRSRRRSMGKRVAIFPAGRQELYERNKYSAAVVSGGFLFVSGQVGSRADGSPEPDPEAQLRLAYRNLEAVLAAGGCTLDDIVELTIYTVDPERRCRSPPRCAPSFWGSRRIRR